MNQEFTITLKQIIIIWFIGFATGAPLMNLLVTIKYGNSVILPILNFIVMSGVSIAGLILFMKKDGKNKSTGED